jgi:hypothetical protein
MLDQAVEIPTSFFGVLVRTSFKPHAKQVLQRVPKQHTANRVWCVANDIFDNINRFKPALRVVSR